MVYFEAYRYVATAIAREKQIKRWRREKKLALIESMNPQYRDLAADSFEPQAPSVRSEAFGRQTQGPSTRAEALGRDDND